MYLCHSSHLSVRTKWLSGLSIEGQRRQQGVRPQASSGGIGIRFRIGLSAAVSDFRSTDGGKRGLPTILIRIPILDTLLTLI